MIVVPVTYRDPLLAFQAFADDSFAALLDSESAKNGARATILAVNPYHTITVTRGMVNVDPFEILEKELGEKRIINEIPHCFVGGAVGYFGYELANFLERLPEPAADLFDLPLMATGLYDSVIVFDHGARRAFIVSPTTHQAERIAMRLDTAPDDLPPLNWSSTSNWQAEMSRADAQRRIRTLIDQIHAGELFQANFTQRFLSKRPDGLSDFDIYRRLRSLSPAPFSAFLRCDDISIAGASPERFLKLDTSGKLEACPIKGTRPRDPDPMMDAMLALQLRISEKDLAENLMIVDLMRNDLGRVCEIGSVRVPRLCGLESFASVHHLVSRVEGQIRAGLSPIDVLRATFPGGSITGAPKIRAMEIIRELEPSPRGAYCGCLGWIGFDGAMDMSMTIRTLTLTPDILMAQAGGGIVADSHPSHEYDECMVKIAPLLAAITGERVSYAVAQRQAANG